MTFVCDGSVSEVQTLVSNIVREVPGFGGCAPDPDNPGGYIINVTDPGVNLEAARAAILSEEPSEALESAGLRAVQLDVSGVRDWYQQAQIGLLTELPDEHREDWRYYATDWDEVHDQVIVWYASDDARAWAQTFILVLEELDAPPGVIVAIVAPPPQED